MAGVDVVTVVGWNACSFHQRAISTAQELVDAWKARSLEDKTFQTRDAFVAWLEGPEGRVCFSGAAAHATSPFVSVDGSYLGGCDSILLLSSRLLGREREADSAAPPLHAECVAPSLGYGSKASLGGKGLAKCAPPARGIGKSSGKGKDSMTYKERQKAELVAQEETLSAEEGFSGKALTAWETRVIVEGATDQEEGPYGGKRFFPKRGYFACKRCGNVLYVATAKFVH